MKISLTCYKDYDVKIKMVQEQWIQLKMTFLLGCNLNIGISGMIKFFISAGTQGKPCQLLCYSAVGTCNIGEFIFGNLYLIVLIFLIFEFIFFKTRKQRSSSSSSSSSAAAAAATATELLKIQQNKFFSIRFFGLWCQMPFVNKDYSSLSICLTSYYV